MPNLWERILSSRYKYELVGHANDGAAVRYTRLRRSLSFGVMLVSIAVIAAFFVSRSSGPAIGRNKSCDTTLHGYQCQNDQSHFWGQYSPFFSVPSEISPEVPHRCDITFASILSRHGARDPTASKTMKYNETIQKVHANVKTYSGIYAFLADYDYTLGADQLTAFGQQELVNSGIKFYDRYKRLARHVTPFLRTSSESRVVESALNWTHGYHSAKLADRRSRGNVDAYPYPLLIISEEGGQNNTLNHGLCSDFENGPDSEIADNAQATWAGIFVPPIQARLNEHLLGANLSDIETIYMMDLCPFNTVASVTGVVSPFCALFTEMEWHQYGYYESLNKYYGYSYGNPLGPTQGVGYANELIARLTSQPVRDVASINSTLDDNTETFPLNQTLYADFSHDNDLTAILSALGLYNATAPLSNTSIETTAQSKGYSAAWTVPFASRAYFEKMQCRGQHEELVRVIVNDRVLPLTQCRGDKLGRCTLNAFIDSLGFATSGGLWDLCFARGV